MEVEELSPLAHRFSLTPTKGATEEDDGFVDILESDLKVSSVAPLVCLPLCPWGLLQQGDQQRGSLGSCSKTMTSSNIWRRIGGN